MEAAAKSDNALSATAARYDELRKRIPSIADPNKLVCTSGIVASFGHCIGQMMDRVKRYDAFTANNDPWKEHDFGAFEFEGEKIFWKIDDYRGEGGLQLVLTIMLAEEY